MSIEEMTLLGDQVEKLNRRVLTTRRVLLETPAYSHLFETHCAVLRDQEQRLARMRRSLQTLTIEKRHNRPHRRASA